MSSGWIAGLIVAVVVLGGGFAGYVVIKHKIEQVFGKKGQFVFHGNSSPSFLWFVIYHSVRIQ